MTGGFVVSAIAVIGLLAMLFSAMWQTMGRHNHKWVLSVYSDEHGTLYECAYPDCDETRTTP